MADKVVKLYTKDAAKNPDAVLEQALGSYQDVLVLGWDEHGNLDARASLGLSRPGDLLWLVEAFKANMLDGVYAERGED